jgi:beta-lactam-binding protein with PASTA domain
VTLLAVPVLAVPLLAGCQPPAAQPGASGSPSVSNGALAVPNVVGKRLSDAIPALTAAGFTKIDSADAGPEHRVVVNPSNWTVRAQTPAAGTRAQEGTRITLTVTKPTDDAGGSAGTTTGVMPAVVCKDLQTAQDALQAAGFPIITSTDGTGQGRTQVVDRNWVVIAQSAPPGSHPSQSDRVVLTVVKFGEDTKQSGCAD